MNYNEWMKEQYLAKMHKKTITGRISSKKATLTDQFFDLATETDKFEENQQKAREKALKSTNDAELARRNRFFGSDEPAGSTPNPNLAFRRKKKVKGKSPISTSFYVPPHFTKLYRSLLDEGHSIIHARNIVRDYMKQEEEGIIRVDTEVKPTPGKYWDQEAQEWKKDKPADEDGDYERNEDPP